MFFIIPFIASVFSAVKTAWEAFKAIKIIGTALTVGKLLKAVQVIAFLGSLQRPKIPSAGSELDLQIDPNAGLPIAIGERLTYGTLARRVTWKGGKNNAEPNQILGMVKVLSSGGPIESIEYCQLGDNKVTNWSGNPLTGLASVAGCTPSSGKVYTYESNYHQRWSKGDLTGSVSDLAYFNAGGWTGYDNTSSLTGFAWIAEVLKNNNTTFPQSVPASAFLIKGLKWYDPRKDSTVEGGSGSHRWDDPDTYDYNTNGFIVSYNIIRGRLEKQAGGVISKSWGLHIDPALIDLDSFIAAANIADAYGWKINAIGNTTDTPKDFIDKILQCTGGYLISQGAKISAFINAPQTTVYDITDDDIVGEVEIPTSTSYRDRINSAIPVYPEPALLFEDNYADAITVQKYQDEDGELKQTELHLDYCTDIDQAVELTALEIVNSREFISGTIVCKPRLLQVKIGQTVNFTSSGLNIAAGKYLVVGREIDLSTLCVRLKLRSEDDTKYDWIQGLSPTAPDSKAIQGIEWAEQDAPDADNFIVAPFVDEDQVPAFLISASLGDIPDAVTSIRFDYKLSSDSNWSLSGSVAVHDYDHLAYVISGLKPVSYYDIAIYYVNSFGVVTDRTIFTNKLTSKLVSTDTQNVAGIPSGDLVNSVVEAYDAAWNAVNEAANIAAELTAQAAAFADALDQEAHDRANAIAASAASLQASIDALEGQIDSVSLAPAWSNTAAYVVGDIVTDNGSLWKAVANGTNHEPPSSYWVLIGNYDSISGAVDGLATQVNLTNATVYTLQNGVTSTASDLTSVKARLSNVETKANTTATALTSLTANVSTTANTVASQANAITAVQSNVTALQANGAGFSSAISALQSNSISQGANIATQASQITALQSNAAATATAISGLQTNSITQGNTISTMAGQITSLQANGAGYSSAIGSLQANSSSQGANIASQANQIISLQSSLGEIGDNLIYNPSFESGTAVIVAEGWRTAGTYVDTLVTAGFSYDGNQGKSQRINAANLTTAVYSDLVTAVGAEAQVTAGKTYTLSAYFIATVGLFQPRIYVQFRNASGTVLSTPTSILGSVSTGSWTRLSVSGVAPSGAVDAVIYLRTFGATASPSAAGTIYWDMVQFEGGSLTAFRDNIRASTAALATQSTAITALQTLTTQQGSNISTQASAITALNSRLGAQPNLLNNGGFSNGLSGWTAQYLPSGSTLQSDINSGIWGHSAWTAVPAATAQQINIVSSVTPINAGFNYCLSGDVFIDSGASCFCYFTLEWQNSSGGVISYSDGVVMTGPKVDFTFGGGSQRYTYFATGTAPTGAVGVKCYLVFRTAATDHTQYLVVRRVKLEMGSTPSAWADEQSTFAAASAINSLTTSVNQTNGTVTATASSLSTLSTTVGGHTTSISSLQTTTNGLSGRASLTINSDGAVTGFSITSNAAAGSTFAIQADKFILTSGTKAVSPFTVDTVNNKVVATNLVVDTLQIKDGALTNFQFSQDNTATDYNTPSEITLRSVTITTSGGWIDLSGNFAGYGTGGLNTRSTYTIRLYRGSTVLVEIPYGVSFVALSGTNQASGGSGFYVDSIGAGTYTYSLRIICTDYTSSRAIKTTYTALRAVEFKR